MAAWVPFEGQSNPNWTPQDTSVWPVQKYSWRDLTARQRRDQASLRPTGQRFKYRIRPLGAHDNALQPVPVPQQVGYQGNPIPLSYLDEGAETDWVELTSTFGEVQAAVNNGILSTQWLSHAIQQTLGKPISKPVLTQEIKDLNSPIRAYLAGDLPGMLQSMFDRLEAGGTLYLALYELTDQALIGFIVKNAAKIHVILSNTSLDKTTGSWDEENSTARATLHGAVLAEMHDRMFNNSQHIGHNKFAVYVDAAGKAQAVLAGSTNWTSNGLCAQSNNCFIADLPALAEQYLQYWQTLKADTASFEAPNPPGASTRNVQGAPLRSADSQPLKALSLTTGALRLWCSPNTKQTTKPASPALPPDLAEVYGFLRSAKRAIFFAVFLPGMKGATSIVQEAIDIGRKDPSLMVYGAVSSPMAMPNYVDPRGEEDNSGGAKFQPSIFEEGAVHIVRANALTGGDVVGNFEQELLSAGNAIIHDKILVIDPLSDDSVVVTGSHNLGYKASYGNDDNLIIVRRNPALAQAYMVHVLDLYEHYRFRGVQAERAHTGQRPWIGFLATDDSWQAKYAGGNDLSRYLAGVPSAANAHEALMARHVPVAADGGGKGRGTASKRGQGGHIEVKRG